MRTLPQRHVARLTFAMALYRCEHCGCVENTATGFHCASRADCWPDTIRGKALCSACAPPTYPDGTPTEYGRWHGLFKRRSAIGMLVDDRGYLYAEASTLPPSARIVGKIEADPPQAGPFDV
ncbi:hypothetical protein [Paraburkholderia youngii]|uniref:hypothetical protein n=1 Tax=Paraburkholderia youngii TaxID=2782701 RepID=UPI003D1C2A6D